MDKPQTSTQSKNLGFISKTLSAENYCNLTSGEEEIDTVGGEFGDVDIKDKLVNVTKGAPGSSTTGLTCKNVQAKTFINVTGSQKTDLNSVYDWLRLIGPQSGAPSQLEKAKSRPAMENRRAYLEHVISRIEERMANMPSYFDLPLNEFFRPNLTRLYATTGDGIVQLIRRLQEMGELHNNTVEERDAMTTNTKRSEKVYQIVAQRKALRSLIFALEETNNSHVIKLMESWL